MSVDDLIQRGRVFANHAIENDNAACTTNDPNYYSQALSSYQRAIDLYTQAHATVPDPKRQQRLADHISKYRRRHLLMNDWLESYARQQQRQREATQRRSSLPPQHVPSLPTDRDQKIFDSPPSRPLPAHSPSPSSLTTHPNPSPSPASPFYLPSRYFQHNNPSSLISAPSTVPDTPPSTAAALTPYTPNALTSASTSQLESQLYSPSSATPLYPDRTPITPSQNHLSSAASRPPLHPESHQRPPSRITTHPPPATNPTQTPQRVDMGNTHDLFKQSHPNKTFDDIVGLGMAKQILKETIMYDGLERLLGAVHKKWASILLFGPTGTGKRILAEATAKEGAMSYVKIWGEDFKQGFGLLTETLNTMGKVVVHVEDVENMPGSLRAFDTCDDVLWIFTTREPWKLDEAFLRRVERRVYIGMPRREERAHLLETLLRDIPHDITLEEMEFIAKECENFSGADLEMLVRDATMEPVRTVRDAKWFRRVRVRAGLDEKDLYAPCDRADRGALEIPFRQLGADSIQVPAVACLDFDLAMESTKPSVKLDTVKKHIEFMRGMGMDGS